MARILQLTLNGRARVDAVPDERLAAPVEATVYFLVSEGLANVVKHARASKVRLSVVHEPDAIVVEIEDDGAGGADPAAGSGLRGMVDRVQALDGVVAITSPPGRGTRVRAEIPCA